MTTIRFRRGNKANLPISAPSGMPLWCEDTKELYMGTDDSVAPISGASGDNLFSFGFVPYSVNSGNQDSNGYVDLIEKISDTEIAFKVGGSYPNMGITFPNGRHYVISSISNITELLDDTIYTFILFESNLTDLGDGTYSAIATAVKIGYTANNSIVPDMTANSQDGFIASCSQDSSNAFKAFDGDDSTYVNFDANLSPENSLVIELPAQSIIKKGIVRSTGSSNGTGYGEIFAFDVYGSNDGVNWTNLQSFSEETKNTDFEFKFSSQQNYKYFSLVPTNVKNHAHAVTWELHPVFVGGSITEALTLPDSPNDGDLALLINQKPLKSYLRQNSSWVEKQFVKLGEVQKLSGLMGTPVSYAFNGEYYYEQNSGNFISSTTDINHNIGSMKLEQSYIYAKKYSDGSLHPLYDYDTTGSDSKGPFLATITCKNNKVGKIYNRSRFRLYTESNLRFGLEANYSDYGLVLWIRRSF